MQGDGPGRWPGRWLRKRVWAVIALFVAVFSTSPLHSPLNNPNEGVRVFTVKALVESHTFTIDDVVAAWGYVDDKAIRDGKLYQSKAPLPTLLAAAGYAVVHPFSGDLSRTALTRLCRFFGAMLPCGLVVCALWVTLSRRHRPTNGGGDDGDGDGDGDDGDDQDTDSIVDVVMVALVLGSGVLATLHVFSGHALAAVCSALVMALARDASIAPPSPRDDVVRAAVAGVAVAVGVGAEYPAILMAPLCLVVVARSQRRMASALVCAGAGLVALLPTLVAHAVMWGAPLKTGYSFLENAAYRPLVSGTLFGIGAPDPRALSTSFLSPELGLFFFSPLLLLGLFVLFRPSRWMDVRARVVVVVVVVAYALFIAGFRGWRGGWSVGPRYIAELAGLFSVLAIDALPSLSRVRRMAVFVALAAVGVVHSGVAGAFFPHLPDVFRTPVGTFVLPMVWRGFCPDSPILMAGLSPSTAAAVVVVVLLLPLIIIAARTPRAALGLVVLVPVVALNLSFAHHGPRDALEARRMMDNWRPDSGNPYLVASATPAALFAIDRARAVDDLDAACDAGVVRVGGRDVGAGARVLGDAIAASDADVVVIDDALADHIGAAGGDAIVMTVSDARRLRRLPCRGTVDVLLPEKTPFPASLSKHLRVSSSSKVIRDGFVLWSAERLDAAKGTHHGGARP